MKRDGFVIEEVVTDANMNESFDYVMRGKKRKKSKSGRYIMKNREKVINRLKKQISDGSFCVSRYREMIINERGKQRIIQVIPLVDRIGMNAVMRVVEKHLHKRFIADTAASIKGRGGHYLHKRMMMDMKAHPDETSFVYVFDLKKFYENVDQDIMMEVICRFFKDKKLIKILEGCVKMLPSGMSIGLRSSQALCNLLLSYYLDHVLKDEMGLRFYRRYCDDGRNQAGSMHELTPIVHKIHECAERANLTIKGNEQLYCIKNRDIDFLGLRLFHDGKIEIRKHIKQRFARRWKRVKSRKRKQELIASFYGISKHAHAQHLFKQITGISMKQFSDFGLNFVASDGKKRFDCQAYPLSELQNREIVIEDYETNVKTREGDGRYLVKFKSEELGEGKFFTNSEEIKQLLDRIAEEYDDGFPFATTIKRKGFGNGRAKYSFT